MCGVDGCQSMFHHLCQTEWEIHQYHLDYPNGKPQDCVYDSGGKKRCVHHHPHGNLAVNPPLADQSQPLHSDSMPAPGSKRMEVSDEIANVPPIVEDVSNLNNETTQSNSNVADINPNEVIPSNVEEEVKVNNVASQDMYSSASSEDEGLDDNHSVYTGPVTSMFGHLKGLQTNKVDEMDASDNADTSTQLHGNERNDSQVQFQKYPKGSLVIKTFDSDEISGFVKSFDTQTGVYTVQWSDDTEDLWTEFPMKHLIVESTGDDISKQKWIPCKD